MTGLFWVLLSACAASPTKTDLAQTRRAFIEARAALRNGDTAGYAKAAAALQNYPLLDYLEHDRLLRDIASVEPSAVQDFLRRTSGTPIAQQFRAAWLQELARRERWQEIADNYQDAGDPAARCLLYTARERLGQTTELWDAVRAVWLTAKAPPPKECEAPFTRFENDSRTGPLLVWQKARIALENNQTEPALKLASHLDAQSQKIVQLWTAVIKDPRTIRQHPELRLDSPSSREISLHAIKLLAKRDFRQASAEWVLLKENLQFSSEQIAQADRAIALAAAQALAPEAKTLLDRLSAEGDGAVQSARLRTGIAERDWASLFRWLSEAPALGMESSRWWYWRGRAAELLGKEEQSRIEYRKLAEQFDYYGRLAQEHGNLPVPTQHADPASPAAERMAEFASQPAVVRARELFFTGFLAEARLEWTAAVRDLPAPKLELAAALAAEWNWPDRSIATLSKVPYNRDLRLRFPQPFREQVLEHARRVNLDPALVYGVMRTESIFMEDAQSRAGALGLMQLMPATGKETAVRVGLPLENPQQLLAAQVNIPLGVNYLSRVLQRFQGNPVLAVAAYNAGPMRVDSWRPAENCEQAEYWIEMIPYSETRGYVRNVLFAASIYGERESRAEKPLSALLVPVTPKTGTEKTAAGCELNVKNTYQ